MQNTVPLVCGIDFGTSNSTCAIFDEASQSVRPILLEDGKTAMPSAVFYGDDGAFFAGRAAISAYTDGEDGRFLRSLKSILGTELMQEKTVINNRAVSFTDIVRAYLAFIKSTSETQSEREINAVVLGRPVHFHDDNPEADQKAQQTLEDIARAIGFQDIAFQYEPIAAAFSHETSLQKEALAMVIDLGGGTSDFTIMRLYPQKGESLGKDRSSDILATSGIRVGGTDFDRDFCLSRFMPLFGYGSTYRDFYEPQKILPMPKPVYHDLSSWPHVHRAQTKSAINQTKELLRLALEPEKCERLLKIQENEAGHALLQVVEDSKIILSSHESTPMITNFHALSFDDLGDSARLLSRKDFEEAVASNIQRIEQTALECLKSASLNAEDITLLIMTGGSSELPAINIMAERLFPHASISKENKFGSVGLGLAVHARAIFK